MTPDAYDLLKQALWLWQQNALANNDATEINKNKFNIPLNVKTPEGIWEINNVKHDQTYGILFECNIKPYVAESGD